MTGYKSWQKIGSRLAILMLLAGCTTAAFGESGHICHEAVAYANGGGNGLTLAEIAEQPASMLTCASGYWFEKCGDHATANRIFDKCIAAGYTGAMIWKGLMYENGNGVPKDDNAAANMFKRAATSGTDGYATLGKVHYASALYEGKGVPRDEEEALRWFRAAAAEGSKDAEEFLRTGYHSAGRDAAGKGVGVLRSLVQGQRLERAAQETKPSLTILAGLLVTAAFAVGLVSQAVARKSLFN